MTARCWRTWLASADWGRFSRAAPAARLSELVAVVALTSLFVRSEAYPVVATVSVAEVRVQDVLFAWLVVLAGPRAMRWAERRRPVAVGLLVLLACLLLAALRSPDPETALVAVVKVAEFFAAGTALALLLPFSERPRAVTAAFVLGVVGVAIVAAVDLAETRGLSGVISCERSGGPLSFDAATAVAGLSILWLITRWRAADGLERWAAAVGGAGACGVLVMAKSALVVAVAVALLLVYNGLRPQRPVMLALGLILLVGTVLTLRGEDLSAGLGLGPRTQERAPLVAIPEAGDVPSLPMPFNRREPELVNARSYAHRVALAYLGVRLALEAPLLGHGWLVTQDAAFLRSRASDELMLQRLPDLDPVLLATTFPGGAHNAMIQMWADAGVLAALSLTLLVLCALVPTYAVLRRTREAQRAFALGSGVLVLGILLSSNVHGGQAAPVLFGLALGLAPPPSAASVSLWARSGFVIGAVGIASLLLMLHAGTREPARAGLERAAAYDGPGLRQLYEGDSVGDGELEITNGLLTLRLDAELLVVKWSPTYWDAGSGSEMVLGRIRSRAPIRVARIIRSTSEGVAASLRTLGGREVAQVGAVRGVPGVFVRARTDIEVPTATAEAVYGGRSEGQFSSLPDGPVMASAPVAIYAAAPSVRSSGARIALAWGGPRVQVRRHRNIAFSTDADSVYFLSAITPELNDTSSSGMYLRAAGLPPAPASLQRLKPPTAPPPGSVRFIRADRHRSGAAESISLGLLYCPWWLGIFDLERPFTCP